MRRTGLGIHAEGLGEHQAQQLDRLDPTDTLSYQELFPEWDIFPLTGDDVALLKNGICPPLPPDMRPKTSYFFYETDTGFCALIRYENGEGKVVKNHLESSSPKLHNTNLIF